jgi:ketosteroid isomerase-like protein
MYKLFTLAVFVLLTACQQKSADTDAKNMASGTPPPAEIGNPELIEIGKAAIAAMSSGDIEAFASHYADDAIYRWNSGDSLSGKAAIYDYWSKRRGEEITSIVFEDDIWLPVKVNTPANAAQAPGEWLLGWYRTTATYKSGKSMTQWIHADHHFNADGKIDHTIQYLDRSLINAAMTK